MSSFSIDPGNRADASLPPVRKILPTCLFLSGFCALAYQVSWARYLSMFLGATAPAYTIVLSTFMGGLAVGAWLFGRMSDQTPRPLRLYARLELIVAGLCLVFPFVIDLLGPLYLILASPVAQSYFLRDVLRALLAIAVLAGPSILMGGTLPAASRFYVRNINRIGSGVGRLYFVNAFGAVFGTLAAGIFLIPHLGLHGTFWIAALINAAIGFWALRVSRRIDGASALPAQGWEEKLEADSSDKNAESPFPAYVAAAALIATAASGAASMIYEVSWIRLLSIVLGGSTYAFTIMLAAVILGIAIGSFMVAAIPRLARAGLKTFGILELAVAFVVILMIPVYNRLSFIYVNMASGIPREPGSYPQFLFVGFALCVATLLIPTVLLGATFPLAARLTTRSMPTLGGGVGRAYCFNTGGTLVGTIIAAHILFPTIGLYGTFAFAAALNLAAGLLCLCGGIRLFHQSNKHKKRRLLFSSAAFSALAAVALSFALLVYKGPKLEEHVLSRGMFRSMTSSFTYYDQFLDWLASGTDILYYKDGAEGTIAILDYQGHLSLQINGKADASSEGDMPTQICLGHLPVVMHPEPERVLVVGLGSGATSAAVLAHEGIELTTIELSPEIVEAAEHFSPYNRDVLNNPRLNLLVEDAKAYLGLSREFFDIIISEPSNPWVAGNANLFTLDFYELMKSRLAPGGFVGQWFHDYEMTDDTVRTIIRTFTAAFPYTRLFHCGAGRDYILLGGLEPLAHNPDRIDQAIANSKNVADDLETHLSIRSHLGFYTRNVLDDSALRALGSSGKVHSSRRPTLDFMAPKGVFLRSMSELIVETDQRQLDPEDTDILITALTRNAPLEDDASFAEFTANITRPFYKLRESAIRQWIDRTGSADAYRELAIEMESYEWNWHALAAYQDLHALGEATLQDEFAMYRLEILVALEDSNEEDGYTDTTDFAISQLSSLAKLMKSPQHWEKLGDLYIELDMPSDAASAYHRSLEEDNINLWDRLKRLVGLIDAKRMAGDEENAFKYLGEAYGLRPDYWPLRTHIKELNYWTSK